jgi:hypothetical protein
MGQGNPAKLTRISLGALAPFNPSVCEDYVLVRTANYSVDVPLPSNWTPDSRNFLYRLRGRKAESPIPLTDGPRSLVFNNGLEDGRLIRHNGRLLALFSGLYQTWGSWVITKSTMILWDIESREYRSFPTGKREKNWMPFTHNGDLYALTSTCPFECLNLTGTTVLEGRGLDSFWSGSSQFIPHGNGYLGVVHRHESRKYVHAFVYMDENFNLDLSPPFRFLDRTDIEFCAGIERHGDELCLSFGVHDEEAYLLWISNSATAGTGP